MYILPTLLTLLSYSAECTFGFTVQMSKGAVRGKTVAVDGQYYDIFLGIPYAQPPVGHLRFRPSQPAESHYGVLDATSYGPLCPQPGQPESAIDEDCLYLNIFTPQKGPVSPPYPVLVYVDGGAFLTSDANHEDVDSIIRLYVSKGVIFVNFNYRLGLLGFWSTGDETALGNYGLWDQTTALKWITEEIARFGGDPTSITVMGYSAGSASASLLSMSPESKDLFKKAIFVSGSGLTDFVVRDSLDLWNETAHAVGCQFGNARRKRQLSVTKEQTSPETIYKPELEQLIPKAHFPDAFPPILSLQQLIAKDDPPGDLKALIDLLKPALEQYLRDRSVGQRPSPPPPPRPGFPVIGPRPPPPPVYPPRQPFVPPKPSGGIIGTGAVFTTIGDDGPIVKATYPRLPPQPNAYPHTYPRSSIDCMRSVPWQELLHIQGKFPSSGFWRPRIDGSFLPDAIEELAKNRHSLNAIVGTASDEFASISFGEFRSGTPLVTNKYQLVNESIPAFAALLAPGDAEKISLLLQYQYVYADEVVPDSQGRIAQNPGKYWFEQDNKMKSALTFWVPSALEAQTITEGGQYGYGKVYLYSFNYVSESETFPISGWKGATHGAMEKFIIERSGHPGTVLQAQSDIAIQILMSDLFTSFAIYGEPTSSALSFQWPPLDVEKWNYLAVDKQVSLKEKYHIDDITFTTRLLSLCKKKHEE